MRGYGLVDIRQGRRRAGQAVEPDARCRRRTKPTAAKYYPAIYWYSMLKIPDAEPVRRARTATFPTSVTQTDWLNLMKNNGCVGCHQLGQLSTRTIPAGLGRVREPRRGMGAPHAVGPVGRADGRTILAGQLGGAPIKYFGDWTDRIAKGELPHAKPTRPQGVERNIVVTPARLDRPEDNTCTT